MPFFDQASTLDRACFDQPLLQTLRAPVAFRAAVNGRLPIVALPAAPPDFTTGAWGQLLRFEPSVL